MRTLTMAAMAFAVLVTGGLQLVPVHAGVNPPVVRANTIEATMGVPAGAEAVLQKACRNCHSYETEWPWYSRIAPVSWMVQRDVDKARKAMNLSDWHNQNGRTKGRATATLMAACAGLESGRMPPAPYRTMHPEAKLSAEEVKGFCEWTRAEAHAGAARAER